MRNSRYSLGCDSSTSRRNSPVCWDQRPASSPQPAPCISPLSRFLFPGVKCPAPWLASLHYLGLSSVWHGCLRMTQVQQSQSWRRRMMIMTYRIKEIHLGNHKQYCTQVIIFCVFIYITYSDFADSGSEFHTILFSLLQNNHYMLWNSLVFPLDLSGIGYFLYTNLVFFSVTCIFRIVAYLVKELLTLCTGLYTSELSFCSLSNPPLLGWPK